MSRMKALRIHQHGPIDRLAIEHVDPAPLGADDVRVRVEAAAINPSDLASALGAFPGSPLPRILGRDFAGTVIEGPDDLLGLAVWGSGGDLGISRDGTHAESVVLPRAAIAKRPSNLSAEQAAAVGVPFVTAWSALEVAGLAEGQAVLVSGATGAVGSAAIQLARARGARAIALVRDEASKARVPAEDGVAIAHPSDLAEVTRASTAGRGCDVALNGVGAALFDTLLGALADGGKMVTYAAAAGREVTLDLFAHYRRRIAFLPVNSVVLDVTRGAEVFRALTPLFESGALRPPEVHARFALDDARAAYAATKAGEGKVVLVPSR